MCVCVCVRVRVCVRVCVCGCAVCAVLYGAVCCAVEKNWTVRTVQHGPGVYCVVLCGRVLCCTGVCCVVRACAVLYGRVLCCTGVIDYRSEAAKSLRPELCSNLKRGASQLRVVRTNQIKAERR